jgi:TldD protein
MKPLLKKSDLESLLKEAVKHDADWAEVFVEEVQFIAMTSDNGRLENLVTGMEKGAGIRTVRGDRVNYTHTSDLSEDGLFRALRASASGTSRGAIAKSLKDPESGERAGARLPPSGVKMEAKVGIVSECENAARSSGAEIIQVTVMFRESLRRFTVANTMGTFCSDEQVRIVLAANVVAGRNGEKATGYESAGWLGGYEFFEQSRPGAVGEEAARRALLTLGARQAPSGTMPVVVSCSAGGTMIHEAVGHGLESDHMLKGMSVYSNKLGKAVASNMINVSDDPTLEHRRGSYSFDDEGTRARRNLLIEEGILRSCMNDLKSALKSGTEPSGNGRRESYTHPPVPRMSNTCILPGHTDPEEILRATPEGMLVVKMGGGQVNTVTGDFVFEVSEGYMIRDGRKADPVKGATLIGNGPKVLMDIDMVGSDWGFGIGTCGKEGQGVPVADAQPTLRIPQIVVGGRSG